ncbi:MAG: hypothetical protein KKF52_04260 [Nanoarchaeota archaeon]|nr:hypothetical protein [Nanoarchaeota archaeon]MBU4242421.1 hypothetical protein [Nanoarchaeota archaeon]MBU4351668.1 hypothetical protein [Nanoarchaeota archaeon]
MEINKIFKKHFWKFLIIDFVFVFLLLSFIIFSKLKVKQYFSLIENYTTEISGLQVALQQESAEGLANLQVLLSQMAPLADKLVLFALFVVPTTIFILWVLNQTMNFSLINKDKWFSLKHLLHFTLYTLPFFLLFLLIGNQLLTLLYERLLAVMISWQFYVYFILLVLLFYLAQVFYSFVFKEQSSNLIKKSFLIAVKEFSNLFVYYLPYIGTWFIVFILLISTFLKYTAKDYVSLLLISIPLIFFLLVLSWFRIFFTQKVQEKF